MSTLPERLSAVEATIEGWRDGASAHGDWARETLCRVLAYLLEDCARARELLGVAQAAMCSDDTAESCLNRGRGYRAMASAIITRLEAVIGKGER